MRQININHRRIFIYLFIAIFPLIIPSNNTFASSPPVGWIDTAQIRNDTELYVNGWAVDPDQVAVSIPVHFYIDGPAGSGVFLGATTANIPRQLPYPGNHHFEWTFNIPILFRTGSYHEIFVHGIDSTSDFNKLLYPEMRRVFVPQQNSIFNYNQIVYKYGLSDRISDLSGDGRININDIRKYINPNITLTPPVPESKVPTKIGIFYLIWHCAAQSHIYNIKEAISGKAPWGPIPEYHWWDIPREGYYCLSQNDRVLRLHAEQLRDAGIDFAFVDMTNWPSITGTTSRDIIEPFDRLLSVWSTVPGAPKIVPWVIVSTGSTLVDTITSKLLQYANLHQIYENKPMLFVVDNAIFPPNDTKINYLKNNFTIRKMWAHNDSDIDKWSFLQKCQPGFKESSGEIDCLQPLATHNGQPEQISVTTAYQLGFMSNKSQAIPKFNGKTFKQQFKRAFDINPKVPFVTITGWNEWIAQRFCSIDNYNSATAQGCTSENDHFPDGSKLFVDTYDVEYNRDIEPADNEKGDYYYRLMKSCVILYKSGNHCDSNHTQELCCQ